MDCPVIKSQMKDKEAFEDLLASEAEILAIAPFPADEASGQLGEAIEKLRSGRFDLAHPTVAEAIVRRTGYPSLLIQDGTFEAPRTQRWRNVLEPNRRTIEASIANVGRVDLVGHPDYKWVGTMWRASEDIFVTNQHVASIFAESRNDRHIFRRNVRVYVDLLEEHESDDQLERLISSIVHIEDRSSGGIDMAILKLDQSFTHDMGDPIALHLDQSPPDHIAVIGYPAWDGVRNPVRPMNNYFQDIYNVKRIAPGQVMDANFSADVFTHNATTLGGNSGSAVIDVETGCAYGLHFAGNADTANYAAKSTSVAEVLRSRSVAFSTCSDAAGDEDGSAGEDGATGERRSRDFSDRDGYRPDFLGRGHLFVPLPQLNSRQRMKLAKTRDGKDVLDYRHFSVVMNGARRLAFYAAANIDGDELRRPRRVNSFKLDPRMESDFQSDNSLYRRNPLDRGHLIRRLDPTWGTRQEAEQANIDSMFYTNIGPQHKDLNQKIWLKLEEHILDKTGERDARVSVFVGCLFDDDDPEHEPTGTKVPMAFWKVVASIGRVRRGRANVRELQAQAFILDQGHLVKPADLEIVFGRGFEEHQVTIEELERLTGLDFGNLRDADTFGLPPETRAGRRSALEAMEVPFVDTSDGLKPLTSLDDVVLGGNAG